MPMIKVVPFNETRGSSEYKKFIDSPFTVDLLFPVFGDKSNETLFEDWRGKDMLNGLFKFSSNKNILEFHPTYYTIKKSGDSVEYKLTYPKTINNFINDLNSLGIELYWTELINKKFEPKNYLKVEEIKLFWTNLLTDMGKSHELL